MTMTTKLRGMTGLTIADYTAKRQNPKAKPAQARVHGILRGGFLLGKYFYYFGKTPERAPIENTSELQVHGAKYKIATTK